MARGGGRRGGKGRGSAKTRAFYRQLQSRRESSPEWKAEQKRLANIRARSRATQLARRSNFVRNYASKPGSAVRGRVSNPARSAGEARSERMRGHYDDAFKQKQSDLSGNPGAQKAMRQAHDRIQQDWNSFFVRGRNRRLDDAEAYAKRIRSEEFDDNWDGDEDDFLFLAILDMIHTAQSGMGLVDRSYEFTDNQTREAESDEEEETILDSRG